MKCEKCGIDILEGNLCDNCKNNVVSQPVINEVPQAYDPVADLMNEPVNGIVNLEKNEMESIIPVGDNNLIPEVPVAEKAVSEIPVVETPLVESVSVVETAPVEEATAVNDVAPAETVLEQENQPMVQASVQKDKKSKIIIVIAIIAGVLLFVLIWLLPFLNSYKQVNDMFNQASVNTFVTEVQEYMNASLTKFMTEALKPENQGQSLEISKTSIPLDNERFDKNYKINLNRNGLFTSLIIYDDNFCYYISEDDVLLEEITKSSITVSNVYKHSPNDNLNDGCHGEKINK